MVTYANWICHVGIHLCILLSLSNRCFGQYDLCPEADECHCYNAWEEEEVRADCLGDVRHVSGELPLNLTQLRISGSENFTHLLSNNMSKYDELNMIEIYANALETVDSNAFYNLQNVEQLYISQNALLTSMPNSVLAPMTTLSFLDLSTNAFTISIFGIFSDTDSLLVLRMDNNPLFGNLPTDAFGDNIGLETVYLTNSQLTGIDTNAFQNMQGMFSAYLDFNSIAQLESSAFTGLVSLDNIHLAFNKLETLPTDVFTEIPSVTYIDLSNNDITTIHDNALLGLPKLKTLNLNVNQLTTVPSAALTQIPSVDFINLSGNKLITVFANAFAGLAELNSILICDIPTLTSIDEEAFNDIANLTSLSLYNNPTLMTLTPNHLPDAQHQTLQILSVSGNAFRTLDVALFISKPHLERVDLTNNPYHCDCNLGWMTEVYADKLVWAKHWGDEGQIPIRCTTPKHLLHFEVLSMKSRDFTCDPPDLLRISSPHVVAHLYTDVIFEVHAYNGIPATRWKGPQGVEHIPVRPFPESSDDDQQREQAAAIILPFEEFNSTELETVVMATLELRSVNTSFTGSYEVTASNHVANVTMTFELEVLPYELTSPLPTTDVVGRATTLLLQCDISMLIMAATMVKLLN